MNRRKAVGPLEKAVEIDPRNPNSRGMLAAALLAVGRSKKQRSNIES